MLTGHIMGNKFVTLIKTSAFIAVCKDIKNQHSAHIYISSMNFEVD